MSRTIPHTYYFEVPPETYDAVVTGQQRGGILRDVLEVEVHDIVRLVEYLPGEEDAARRYTGRCVIAAIDHIMRLAPGLESGYCLVTLTVLGQTVEAPR